MPDRRGNNRIDSLRNIVRDPRVGLLFLIPGVGHTVRVNGRAKLEVGEVYFQCARAVVRSGLWDAAAQVDPTTVPRPGEILAGMSDGRVGGEGYDREWPARARGTLW